ncbi:phosphotransferase enzyme family protein [Paenibacillus gansuensis]|uniref:Phosphotransferase enzyme family protein n=1 Tax=Paenibacillus gansuensis TaxID=306542 RepID=A0ABW5P803_9BACL
MDEFQLLKSALKPYHLNPSTLMIEKKLQSNSWHGDLHFKVCVDNKSYSARFIGNKRYETDVFISVSDAVLAEQIRFCNFLFDAGIPFMKHVPTVNGELFTTIMFGNEEWRFVLFEWIQGNHLTYGTESIARNFGAFARRLHDVSSRFQSNVFPQVPHSKGHQTFYTMLCAHAASSTFSPSTTHFLQSYLSEIELHIDRVKTGSHEFIVQSDLNPLNILWNQKEEITGVVDFESITYTDRVEGLAWLVKWYSRTQGVASHEMSPVLAKTVWDGYRADELLSPREYERLRSLLWLTGCLNWNFTSKTIELIKNNEDALLNEHITKYVRRGKILSSLLCL